MHLARWTSASLPAAVLAVGLSGFVAPASGSPAPDYELPFPCSQQWTGSTRSTHRPSSLAVDLNRPADLGDILVTSAPGVVSRVGDAGNTGYGIWVRVDHGGGRASLYAHLQEAWVSLGQTVDQGAVLGLVGASGGVSGAHLHFEELADGKVHWPAFHQTTYVFGTTLASLNCPDVPLAGDWDGDGADEVAVFRRTARGTFEQAAVDGGAQTIRLGLASDAPVTGDWDGDGRDEVGVRRQRYRLFVLRNADGTTSRIRVGRRGDLAVTGDWDGDGRTGVGVWRPAVARFRLLREDGTQQVVRLGQVGSVPVTGDWNGDGRTDLGVFDPGTATFSLRTAPVGGTATLGMVTFGAPTDLPVTGDWNGDGVTDLGTWTPSTATFSLRVAPTPGRGAATVTTLQFGRNR